MPSNFPLTWNAGVNCVSFSVLFVHIFYPQNDFRVFNIQVKSLYNSTLKLEGGIQSLYINIIFQAYL